jgi:hypothetical protein
MYQTSEKYFDHHYYNRFVFLINNILKSATALNSSVYAAPADGGLGFRSAKSLRYASFPRLTPAQFASSGLASQALIRAGKPSYTAETLCERQARLIGKCI